MGDKVSAALLSNGKAAGGAQLFSGSNPVPSNRLNQEECIRGRYEIVSLSL